MPRWHDGFLFSELMRREMPYRVLLPSNYDYSMLRFPVLYLLHGLHGSFENWSDLTQIVSYSARHQLIIVMPEGESGWYTDGCHDWDKYESYFINEIVPTVETHLRTIKGRSGRAVAGLSMGGYGAIKFALKFPKMFAFAGSVSGAFEVTQWDERSIEWGEYGPFVQRIFGAAGNSIRSDNDLHKLVAALHETEVGDLPYMYFDCGIDDGFLAANERLSEIFSTKRIDHEFQALEGGHDWEYWNERGLVILELAVKHLSKPSR